MAIRFGWPTTLLVAGALTYGIWVSLPRSRYAAEAQSILQRATERDRSERELAKDTANNGYLNPTLLPLWGRKDIEFKPEAEIHETLKKVQDYSDLAKGSDADLETAVRENKSDVLQPFQAFEKLYPQIQQSASAKNFLIPYEEEPSGTRLLPNLLGLRKLMQASAGYAELLTLQGKSDQALGVCGDMLTFSHQVGQQQSNLLMVSIRDALQTIAQHTAAMVLDSSKPSPAALRLFAQRLQETQVDPKSFDQALDTEVLATTAILEHPNGKSGWSYPTAFPGLIGRETRLYYNELLPRLLAHQKGETVEAPPSSQPSTTDWLLGKKTIAGAFIPDIPRAEFYFQMVRKRQGLLHLAVELRLQKATSLTALKDYKPLNGFDPTQARLEKGLLHYPLTPEESSLYGGSLEIAPGMQKWYRLEAGQKEWIL